MAGAAKPITAAQIRAIHAAAARHGMGDAEYRAMLQSHYGAESCTALTRPQATDLLRLLGVYLRAVPAPKAAREPRARPDAPGGLPAGVAQLPSFAQRRLIGELVGEIDWREVDGYARWLRLNMGLGRVSTVAQAQAVIEGLKGIKLHGHVKST